MGESKPSSSGLLLQQDSHQSQVAWEEALRDTKVGPMLHHCQEATSGQVTCLSIFGSTTVPTKSQCRSGDMTLLIEWLLRMHEALGSRICEALGSSHSTTKGCL